MSDLVPSERASAARPDGPRRRWYGSTLRTGALWSLLRQVTRGFLQVPTTILLARWLSPIDFGIAAAAAFFIQLGSRFAELGLNAALVRAKQIQPVQLSSAFAASLALGSLAYLLIFLAADRLGAFFGSTEASKALPVAGLVFLIAPLNSVPSSLQSRAFRFKQMAAADFASLAAQSIVSLVLAWYGFGYWSIVYGQLVGVSAKALSSAVMSGWVPSLRFSMTALRELLPLGMGIQAKRLLEYGSQNLDTLIVGRVLGVQDLGFYDKAYSSMTRLLQRLTIAPGVSFRVFALIHDEPERFLHGYRRVALIVSLFGAPVFLSLTAMAPDLFVLMFGEKWRPAVLPFQILSLTGLLRLLSAYTGPANEAAGRIWAQVHFQALHTVLIVVGVLIGTRWGVAGAALGALCAEIILHTTTTDLLRRTMRWSWRQIVTPLIPGVSLGLVLFTAMWAARSGAHRVDVWAPAALVAIQMFTGVIVTLLFLVWCPFAQARAVVMEVVEDVAPGYLWLLVKLGWEPRPPKSKPSAPKVAASVPDGGARP